jgi:ferrous iron transport protein B
VSIDLNALAKELGCPVIGISAKTGEGISQLKEAMASTKLALPTVSFPQNVGGLARELGQKFGPKTDVLLRNQNRLDSFFLSSLWGGLAFIAIMVFLFQAIFTWSAPAMDFVEGLVSTLGTWVGSKVPVGMFRDFVSEAIFGGFGSFLVFVPQIFVLTFIIGILEDSGYLVRAAIICHRPLSLFGLSGKSFVPLLSGHACAIPAVFATRTIESPRRRLLTIMTLPLMSCSARLPVYSLLIGALIPATTYLGGLVGLQGLCFFGLYAFGLIAGLVVSGLTSATSLWKKESDAPFVLELPPYRIPSWRPLLKRSVTYASDFITKAGLTIFTVTVVVWVLGYFPNGSGQLSSSWLAQLGKSIEWLFTPLGLDWKYGVAVIASFLAREVFVGTLGTLLGIESADENISDLANSISASGLTLASGVALLVFYAIAMQCVSTLAVIRRETGSSKLPMLLFLGYGLLAYTLAFFAYRIFS